MLTKGAVVELSSRLDVSEEPGLNRLNIPNQWLRGSLGRAKKELVMVGMRRRIAQTAHFVWAPRNPHGCILKQGTHSPRWFPLNPFPDVSGDQHTQTPAEVEEHGCSMDCCNMFLLLLIPLCSFDSAKRLVSHENRPGQDWPSLVHASLGLLSLF